MPRSPLLRLSSTFLASVLLIIIAVIIFIRYDPGYQGRQPVQITNSEVAPAWYSLYFSDPEAASSHFLQGGPDKALVDAIDAAHLSVDMAAYDLDLFGMCNALVRAYRRGVAVRVVAESDNLNESEFQALVAAGIPLIDDQRAGLMHNKFVVIDRLEVWTGSMNYTVNGAYHNNNNLLRIRSVPLAAAYTAEFEEMFVDKHFGELSPRSELVSTISLDGMQWEVYFSPEDDLASRLGELIQSAQQNIYFLAYAFTADDIASAMIESAGHGVTVAGVFETAQINPESGSEYERLYQAGLDVRKDSNPANMHHKVMIIDGQIVVTGSYNFSASAQNRNDENALVIHDSQIAAQYLVEFERIYQEARP